MINYADKLNCHQCKGLCCKGHPGLWVDPTRFLRVFALPPPNKPEALCGQLPKGIVLRDVEGVFIATPRLTPEGCAFLAEGGCTLPEAFRPGQCLSLKPAIETLIDGEIHCVIQPEGSTQTAMRNWQRFWNRASRTSTDNRAR